MSSSSRIKTVMHNAAMVSASGLITHFLLGITGLFIVRYLGLSLFSEYSTAMLYMGMFSVLGRSGFNRVFLRECSRDLSQSSYYFAGTILLNGGLALVGWLIALVIAYFRYDTRIFILTVILGTSLMLMSLRTMPHTLFQTHQKMYFNAIINVISSICYTIACFIAFYSKATVFVLAGLHLGMNLLNIILSYYFSFRITFPRFRVETLKTLLKIGLRFCVISFMIIVYTQASGFFLAFFDLGDEVGIFNAAFRLYALCQAVAHFIDSAMSPAVYGTSKEPERMVRGVQLAVRYFTVCGILLAAIFWGRAEWLMVAVFKSEFIRSGSILKLLGIAIAFRFIIFLFQHIVYALDQERFMMVVYTGLAAGTVGASMIFIPRYGVSAAALIFLISEGLMVIFCMVKSEQLLKNPRFWQMFILPVIAGGLTLIFLLGTGDFPFLGLMFSPLIFFGFLMLSQYYRLSEVLFLAKTFFRAR